METCDVHGLHTKLVYKRSTSYDTIVFVFEGGLMAKKKWRRDDWTWEAIGDMTVWENLLAKGLFKNTAAQICKAKCLFVNGNRIESRTELAGGEQIRVQIPKERVDHEPESMDLAIVYEDYDLLIIDKSVGITVNSPGQISLANGIAQYFKEQNLHRKVRFINRIDRDTSGLVMIAKSAMAQAYYQKELEEGRLQKWYRACVHGEYKEETLLDYTMRRGDDGIRYEVHKKGKRTLTKVTPVHYDAAQDMTELDIELLTGRTHQIRVALAHEGHPLVGDTLYGSPKEEGGYSLRAYRLHFMTMRDEKEKNLEVPYDSLITEE